MSRMETEHTCGPSHTQASWLIILVVVLAFVAIAATALAAFSANRILEAQRTTIDQWEYKVVSPADYALQTQLSQLGKNGWVLVFARRALSGSGLSSSSSYEMIFKRRIIQGRQTTHTSRASDFSNLPSVENPVTVSMPPDRSPTPTTVGYPAPDDPQAKKVLRSCIDGKAHAWKNGKWELFILGGTPMRCHVEK